MPKLVAFQAHSDGVLFLFCFPFYNLFLVFSRARAHGMGVIRYELSPFPKRQAARSIFLLTFLLALGEV
jgi:hypothetical protein